MEHIQLRPEEPADYRNVEVLTREAFWNRHLPGCNEHYLLHIMRDTGSFIHELDTIAETGGKIVGNIICTRGNVKGDDGNNYEVLCLGPIAVLPDFQGQGIGSRLIEHTKKRAKEMGYRAIFLYGDPGYYSKFGFVAAEQYEIGTPDNMYADPLQALELYDGALAGGKGRFFEDPVFEIDETATAEFDRLFPPKEKHDDLPSQDRFHALVGMRRAR